MNDSLGDRMKEQYENRTRYMLPRRTYTILRLDGRAFHALTAHPGCQKPFDIELSDALAHAAGELLFGMAGRQFAYVQSDEVSILLTDFATPTTQAHFDGNVQKLASTSAATLSVSFSRIYGRQATFDCRVFTIPDPVEVENYFLWRQKDWIRNSIQMLARSLYPQKELFGKKCAELHEMCFARGINWADLDPIWKNGRLIKPSVWDAASGHMLAPPHYGAAPDFSSNLTVARGTLAALIPKPWEDA